MVPALLAEVITLRPPLGVSRITIGLLVAHFIAISSTVFRLGYRYRRRQLHWDDFWALVAMCFDIFQTVLFVVLSAVDLRNTPRSTQSFVTWGPIVFNPAEIWAARLSIGVTAIRILPVGRIRVISIAGMWGFVALWFAVTIQEIFLCGYPIPLSPDCASKSAPIVNIVANIIGTLWLICWPAYILISTRSMLLKMSDIKLPSTHHRLLIACFATSILLLPLNIVYAVYLFTNDFVGLLIAGHLEVALSLLLCNVLVLVKYVYRMVRDDSSVRGSAVTQSSVKFRSVISRSGDQFGSRGQRPGPTENSASTQVISLSEYPDTSSEGLPNKKHRTSTDSTHYGSQTSQKRDEL